MSTPKPDAASTGVLGLLGGTFDPAHSGHRALAEAALASGAVDRVRWLPVGLPPHREGPQASAEHRLALVALLIADHPAFELDAGEVAAAARGEPSYTVLTLQRLRRELGPSRPLALILGADAFLGLPTWHRWAEIPALAHLLVTTRPGATLSAAGLPEALRGLWDNARTDDPKRLASVPCGLIHHFPMAPLDISATELRRRLPDPDAQLDGLLPPALLRYIRHHHLYC
ncbi:MAG TPA: nicotinate-nucleotide adenylyltransferase [Rhodocyclaceae bacterium]|nr:nicotinate-nucleotide adenylyltransferase [Rhodocyclaceae bacterium]